MSQSHWQPDTLTDPSWQTGKKSYFKIWNAFWNNKEKGDELVAGKDIDLEPLAHSGLGKTRGSLYIREYDVQVYERLCRRAVDPACGGVVLSGQPGTGKTYSLFFLLLKKLTKGEPVLFSPTRREVLYFSSGGVQSNRDIAPSDLAALDPNSLDNIDLTWALINSDEGDKLPPPTALFEECIFPVHATSPHSSRHKDWVKQRGGEVWFVVCWTRDELSHVAKVVAGLRERSVSERDSMIDKAIFKWGWAPRDIIQYLQGKDRALEAALGKALSSLTSSRLFDRLQHDYDDMLSHVIVSSYQSSAMDPELPVLDLKSPYIAHRVQRRLDILHRDELSRFIRLCRAHRESILLAGWAFENLIIDILSDVRREGVLSAPIPGTCVSPSTWSSTVSLNTGHLSPNSIALTHTRFDKTLQDVSLDDTKLYLPSQSNFPLLDAFYLVVDHEARRVKVVVLQMTIFLTHKGSPGGFTFLERLKGLLQFLGDKRLGHIEKRQKPPAWRVSFDYRLVVPVPFKDQGDLTFIWSFPGKFPDSIAGPVSFQTVSSEIRTLIAQEDASFLEEDDA
ncbi:hypothetical protein BDN71DRAFT_1495097 [Pleurotus eryngii]|uniref:Uncharacterized protein n=1 Tax=Pleurotus eryngii TaxID=5323 RepID=A0A9P5ZYU8_PLEER|nr:hypothetical protein BDN71DRAFT_1495097 [Pleurotus eryngii]